MHSYAPPSKEGRNDQLYHILWEDGDEEDYGELELRKGLVELFLVSEFYSEYL